MNKLLLVLIFVFVLPISFAAYDYSGNLLSATHSYNGSVDGSLLIDNVDSINMTINTGVGGVDCTGLGTGDKCLQFSSGNTGVNTSYNYLNTLDNWSISLWLKASNPSGGEQVIISDRSASQGFTVQYTGGNTGNMLLYTNTATAGVQWTNVNNALQLNDSAWHQLGVTYDGTVMRLFFDGTSTYNYTAPEGNLVATNDNLYYGVEGAGGTRAFEGDMTDIIMWDNIVLSDYNMLSLSRDFNVLNDTYYFSPPIDFNGLYNDYDVISGVNIDRGLSPVSINTIGGMTENDILNLQIYASQSTLYLIFRDFFTANVINYTNISLDFIGDFQSSNYIITNGYLQINITDLGDFRLDYKEVGTNPYGYTSATTFLSIPAFQDKTQLIYLENATTAYNITAQVYDQNDKELVDAYIYVMRFDIKTNSYITTEIQRTNYEGKTQLHITPATEKYMFMIKYNDVVVYTSPPQQIIYDPTTPIIFRVNTGTDYLKTKKDITDIDGLVSYTNLSNVTGYFRYSVDADKDAYVCLKVFRFTKNGYDAFGQSCGYASVGVFIVDVNVSSYAQDVTFIGQGYATFDQIDYDILISSYTKSFQISNKLSGLITSSFGFYLALFIMLISLSLFIYKPEVSIISMVFGLVAIYKFDLVTTSLDVVMGLILILMIVVMVIKKKGE